MVAKGTKEGRVALCIRRFNPCSGGLWLLSLTAAILAAGLLMFQSLFWWIMVAKTKGLTLQLTSLTSFNPCSGGLWLLRYTIV